MLDLSQNSFIESEYESKFNETNPYRQYKEIYKTWKKKGKGMRWPGMKALVEKTTMSILNDNKKKSA
jgi:hypothetical protein